MAEPVEIIEVESPTIHCDGNGPALGHPRVFLRIKPDVGEIDCPYCGRRFVLKEGADAHHAH
jgi:uncharacterized Zn-finger protein